MAARGGRGHPPRAAETRKEGSKNLVSNAGTRMASDDAPWSNETSFSTLQLLLDVISQPKPIPDPTIVHSIWFQGLKPAARAKC